MRVNADELDSGSYFVTSGAVTNAGCVNYSGAAAGCTAAQMASHDLAEWLVSLATVLPQGGGRVCRSDLADDLIGLPECEADGSDNPVVVYVWWNDTKAASGATVQFSVSAEL